MHPKIVSVINIRQEQGYQVLSMCRISYTYRMIYKDGKKVGWGWGVEQTLSE